MLNQIRQRVNANIESFLTRIKKEYKLHLVNPILFESIREFSLREGKRIRPILLILSYQGYNKSTKPMSPSLYNAATCMELLHNFMLIHDDIIDRSDLRRGKPTLHKLLGHAVTTPTPQQLGYDLGIIAGDIVYALALDAFLSVDVAPELKQQGLKYFVQTAAFTAMGEFIDTLHGVEHINKVKEQDVFLNYTLKTARYTFDCPLVTGAILAGADKGEIAKLSKLGLMVGQAFQIQDDIIGIFDSEKNIGKSILSDLAESKKTLLVCHANEHLAPKQRKIFLSHFQKDHKTYEDLLAVRKIFIEAGSLSYCLKHIQTRVAASEKLLANLKMKKPSLQLIENSVLTLFKHSAQIAKQYKVTV